VKILLDVGVSHRLRVPLQAALSGVSVESAQFRGWGSLRDDDLLAQAEASGFTILITTDKRLAIEQSPMSLAVIALEDNRRSVLISAVEKIAAAVKRIKPGEHRLLSLGLEISQPTDLG